MEKRHRWKLYEEEEEDADFHYISEEEGPAIQDRESETEHPRKATVSRRSKRVPRLKMEGLFQEARKKLRVGKNVVLGSISDTTPEEHVACCLMMLSRDKWRRAEDDDDNPKARGKYRCGECKKVFKSYQALGGHRANHKRVRAQAPAAPAVGKVHECPFCRRVFSSGQALGGHKRSHFIVRKWEGLKIDLNLPAPVEDEEVSDVC